MRNGLYKANFETPLGVGFGMVHLMDGQIWGGDDGYYYRGTYDIQLEDFSSRISVKRHNHQDSVSNVFGQDDVEVSLDGKWEGDSAYLQGSSPQALQLSLKARIEKLCD